MQLGKAVYYKKKTRKDLFQVKKLPLSSFDRSSGQKPDMRDTIVSWSVVPPQCLVFLLSLLVDRRPVFPSFQAEGDHLELATGFPTRRWMRT